MQRLTIASLLVLLCGTIATARAENWPCWRGPRGDGTSAEKGIPTRWSGTENIAWKTALPGTGHASPIVWNDRIFTVSCDEAGHQRILVSLDRRTGDIVWQKVVLESPLEKKHQLNSFASSTPATDGELVYTTFLDQGQMVVAAYDFDGHERWQVRPGAFSSVHGYCSCPVIFEDKLIVNGDHDGSSYLVALEKATGKTVWKTPREYKTRSYVTPIIREFDGRTQMILSGSKSVASYDPRDGSQHWLMDGPTEQFVASMVDNGSLVFLTAGFPEYHILAIRPDGRGKVGDDHIVWRTQKGAGYVPSPVISGEYLLNVTDGGVATCFEAATGERMWMERIGTHYSASLVVGEGLVHFLDDNGVTKVVRPGPKLDIVAENKLGESCFASPAISHGHILLRASQHLYAIGAKE